MGQYDAVLFWWKGQVMPARYIRQSNDVYRLEFASISDTQKHIALSYISAYYGDDISKWEDGPYHMPDDLRCEIFGG